MQHPSSIPRPGALHWTWAAPLIGVFRAWFGSQAGPAPHSNRRLKVYALAVTALVLVTLVLWGVLGAWELGQYRGASRLAAESGQLAGAAGSAGQAGVPAAGVEGLDYTTLMTWSMVVNLLFFVGLGLFMRWDLRRKA
jgi:hypothetical protein